MGLLNTKKASRLVDLVVDGFDLISKITANPIDDQAAVALRAIVETIHRADEGKISIEGGQLALADLHKRLDALNRSEDAKLERNFKPDETSSDD